MQLVWDDGNNTCGNRARWWIMTRAPSGFLLTHNLGVDRSSNRRWHEPGHGAPFGQQSTDDGANWSKPVEITKEVKRADWT